MFDRKDNESLDLNKFKETLKTQTVWLALIAHRFWPIERIFTSNRNHEANKKLCELFLAKAENFDLGSLPQTAECVEWNIDSSKNWTRSSSRESINPKEYNARILTFKQTAKFCCDNGKSKLLSDFLERQRKFYARESQPMDEKAEHKDITEKLTAFNCLLSGSAIDATNKIAKIIKTNKALTADVCSELALNIFVGRYLISKEKEKSGSFELLPIVNKYLDDLAEACLNLHTNCHIPQLRTLQVTQEEYDMIMQKRNSSLISNAVR